jgi:hypothetical protein
MVNPVLFAELAREPSVYAAGWFTLAMINAGIAQGKNRSGLWWFLLSLPFPPLATFVLVIFFDKRMANPERLID